VSETISAIASLLWPLIVLALILAAIIVFRGPLSGVIKSAEQRDFTIKIGGEEVTVGQLSRQQMDLMSDLQDQVSALRKQVDALTSGGAPPPRAAAAHDEPAASPALGVPAPSSLNGAHADPDTELADEPAPEPAPVVVEAGKAPWERLDPLPQPDAPTTPAPRPPASGPLPTLPGAAAPAARSPLPDTRPKPAGVLWVDDDPRNNALQLDQMERKGIVVETARSTREALQKLTGQRYQLIVSDMERTEDGRVVADAGLELVRTIRAFDRETPVVIYSAGPTAKIYGEQARKAGATMVTGSWYKLSEELRQAGLF
jgi:CheY-like chemotaxis protein